tara:strand:- start:515 stop:622 length:108 start_codon:yes stop_codon:yes gene_type:complete
MFGVFKRKTDKNKLIDEKESNDILGMFNKIENIDK